MGYGKNESRPIKWFDMKNGALFSKGPDGEIEAFDYVEGMIGGVRMKFQEYQGREIPQLQVRFVDPDGDEDLVVSTTFTSSGALTTSAKMLLDRLSNPDNALNVGEIIVVKAYGLPDAEKVTCCAVRSSTDPTWWKGSWAADADQEEEEQPRERQPARNARGNGAMPNGAAQLYGAPISGTGTSSEPPPPTDDDGLPF